MKPRRASSARRRTRGKKPCEKRLESVNKRLLGSADRSCQHQKLFLPSPPPPPPPLSHFSCSGESEKRSKTCSGILHFPQTRTEPPLNVREKKSHQPSKVPEALKVSGAVAPAALPSLRGSAGTATRLQLVPKIHLPREVRTRVRARVEQNGEGRVEKEPLSFWTWRKSLGGSGFSRQSEQRHALVLSLSGC